MNHLDTLLVHPPSVTGEPTGSTSTPLYQTATFDVRRGGYDYSRSGNPTRDVLEAQLARLDGGCRALAYGSGIAAIAAVLRLVGRGREVLVGSDLYGGTLRLLASLETELDLEVRLVDTSRIDAVRAALSSRTALVLLETPSNPMLRISDIPALADLAHAHGALLAVDNSVMTPLLQRPLGLGADIAVQSATKFLGGHGDLTAGVVVVRDPELGERLASRHNAEGIALAPMESWLLLRGLETLAVRLERQIESTAYIASFLRGHPEIQRVHAAPAPGAGVLSFETGDLGLSRRLVDLTSLFSAAVSFGAVGSSISLPCEMSHASVPMHWRSTQDLPTDLVRLAVGIEAPEDLVADLDNSLRRAATPWEVSA